MKKSEKLLKHTITVLGLASSLSFVAGYFILETLRPKMIRFEIITAAEEGMVDYFGIGLLLFLVFCLSSLFQIVKYLKNAKKISAFNLFLIVSGILSLLFIFGDVALLSDIGKQYRYGLAQPEWLILYPVMAFQFMTALVLTYAHLLKLKEESQARYVARDSNIFLIVQYVGIVCGLMGLASSSLGFLFPRAWSLQVHTTMGSAILLVPYALVVIYWFLVKFQEKARQWYDEKQMQDIGKSAFLTLLVSVVFMTLLFVINYNNLGGVVSILWLPLYVFLVLFLFSSGSLYFSGKN